MKQYKIFCNGTSLYQSLPFIIFASSIRYQNVSFSPFTRLWVWMSPLHLLDYTFNYTIGLLASKVESKH